MLPGYIHAGSAKAASTYLWANCRDHPNIFVPERDNCSFFVCAYHRGLGWYEKEYFSGWDREQAVVEFSNSYMLFEPALARIARDLPEVKLSLTLRDPVDVCFLQWAHNKRNSYWLGEWSKLDPHFEHMLTRSWQSFRAWAELGFYASHLKKVYRHFPKERVRVMLYEDLESDARAFVRGYFEFLGVDSSFVSSNVDTMVGFPGDRGWDNDDGDIARGLSGELRQELKNVFRDDVEELEDMIGRDLNTWK